MTLPPGAAGYPALTPRLRPALRSFLAVVAVAKRLQSGRLDAYLLHMLIALIALIAIIAVVTALAR